MGNKARNSQAGDPIALHLKGWRKNRGMSQEQLAEATGMTKATISRIENRKQNWDQAFLQTAAVALRCDPLDLIVRDPSEPRSIWTVVDQLSASERDQAVRLWEAFKSTRTYA